MEQKIREENIENNLVFCIDRRKTFAIKLTQRFDFRNLSHKNKIPLFSMSFLFRFIYKTRKEQAVHLYNFARKRRFRLQFLSESAF